MSYSHCEREMLFIFTLWTINVIHNYILWTTKYWYYEWQCYVFCYERQNITTLLMPRGFLVTILNKLHFEIKVLLTCHLRFSRSDKTRWILRLFLLFWILFTFFFWFTLRLQFTPVGFIYVFFLDGRLKLMVITK